MLMLGFCPLCKPFYKPAVPIVNQTQIPSGLTRLDSPPSSQYCGGYSRMCSVHMNPIQTVPVGNDPLESTRDTRRKCCPYLIYPTFPRPPVSP